MSSQGGSRRVSDASGSIQPYDEGSEDEPGWVQSQLTGERKWAEFTPEPIMNSAVNSIACRGCKNRVGLPVVECLEVRCSFCGVVTLIKPQLQKEAKVPARMPRTDTIRECTRCKIRLAIPNGVVTFQCAACSQVNVAGCIRCAPRPAAFRCRVCCGCCARYLRPRHSGTGGAAERDCTRARPQEFEC